MRCASRDVAAFQQDGSIIGTIDAAEAVEKRGLARAIRADDADDVVGLDEEIDLLHGLKAAEGFAQPASFEQRRHGCNISVLRRLLPSRPCGR